MCGHIGLHLPAVLLVTRKPEITLDIGEKNHHTPAV